MRVLPAGTTWVKLYVPAPANGRWDAEVVADYARVQARLVGTIGRPAPAGKVEILGRQVPAEKASEYITGLNLKLVYLVANPRVQRAAQSIAGWGRMPPEQRALYVQQQVQRLLALDPAARVQAMAQLMSSPQQEISREVYFQLSKEEREQAKASLGGVQIFKVGSAGGK